MTSTAPAKDVQKGKVLNRTIMNEQPNQLRIEIPVIGKIFIFFASCFILNKQYDYASELIYNYGFKIHFFNEKKNHQQMEKCYKANIKKLLAIALFYQNKNFFKVQEYLVDAKKMFTSLNSCHGVAVTAYAHAFFMHEKTEQFLDAHKDEISLLQVAHEYCKESFNSYEKLKHFEG